MTTARLGFDEIGTGGKTVSANNTFTRLDLLVQGWVQDKDLTAPPGGESDGQMWIVGASATGAWATHDKAIAHYRSGTWTFYPSSGSPGATHEGLTVWVRDENVHYTWDGGAWVAASSGVVTGALTVRAATTANITIATALNNGDSLDGVTLATGDLVLVKNQSSAAENGVYVVGVSPARATAFDTYDEHPGILLTVQEGTTNADTAWLCTSNKGGTLNSTSIAFAAYPAASTPASTTELLTGTDTTKPATPDAVAALWEKGSDVASAATITLGEGGLFHITGTTGPITDIDFATPKDGRTAWLIFDSTPTINHHATTLKLPGGANITAAAGDRALVVQENGDNVIVLVYVRASGATLLNYIRSDATANLTAGYTATSFSAGTKSSGTFTPDPANGNIQHATNGGAHTLAPPSTGSGDSVSMVVEYTNNGSAGAVTTSGFTKVTGDTITTTNGHKFKFYISVGNTGSHLNVQAMQ